MDIFSEMANQRPPPTVSAHTPYIIRQAHGVTSYGYFYDLYQGKRGVKKQ